MKLRDSWIWGRRIQRAGHPASAQDLEAPIVTLGWACMVAMVFAAVLFAAYAAI
jgi:hypothetical protein